MLQFFRSNAKGMVGKTIVGTIVVIFTLWGAQSIVAVSTSAKAPVTVNGQDITEYQISRMTDIQKRNIQSQLGEAFDPDLLNDLMIRDSVIASLVQQQLEWQAAIDSGMALSDEAITEIIVSAPVFQVNGIFDKDTYTRLIGQYGYSPKDYVGVVRQDLLNSQLKIGLINSGFILDSEVNAVVQLEDQTRDISLFTVTPSDFADLVEIDDEGIQNYYDANRELFRTEEALVVNYVILSRSRLQDKMTVSDDELRAAYDVYKQQEANKIEKSIAHILITTDTLSDSEAKKLVSELKDRATAGESFDSLAMAYSEDTGSSDFGGDLGVFLPGMFVAEFDDAVNGMQQAGELVGPVKTDFGYHLIKLTKKGSPQVSTLAQMEATLRTDIVDRKVRDELLLLTEDMTNVAFSESNLEVIANQFELTIETSEAFRRSGGPGIFADENVVDAAFAPTVMEDDENSEVVTLADGSLMVMHLNAYQKADFKAVAEVRDNIIAALTVSGARDLADEYARTLLNDIKDAGSLDVNNDVVWSQYPSVSRSGSELSDEVTGRAFKLSKPTAGAFSIDLLTTEEGIISLVAVTAIHDSDGTKDTEGFDDYLGSLVSESEYGQWFDGVAADAKIIYR